MIAQLEMFIMEIWNMELAGRCEAWPTDVDLILVIKAVNENYILKNIELGVRGVE